MGNEVKTEVPTMDAVYLLGLLGFFGLTWGLVRLFEGRE